MNTSVTFSQPHIVHHKIDYNRNSFEFRKTKSGKYIKVWCSRRRFLEDMHSKLMIKRLHDMINDEIRYVLLGDHKSR